MTCGQAALDGEGQPIAPVAVPATSEMTVT